MARRWTVKEEAFYREQLHQLYVAENKTIGEIAVILKLKNSSVFQRLKRLGIPTDPTRKFSYLNQIKDVQIPLKYDSQCAEFFGIMLGDGHISHFQTIVTLGTK
ncbi:hypothetical protein BH11PAT2_BH11PAT2_09870 [soil metagenome]